VVNFATWPDTTAQNALESAQALYAAGLNVFPQPLGKKEGCVWRFMQHTRLRYDDLPEVFAGRCNIAVMVGRTSGNLFVLDYETEAGFRSAVTMLRMRRIPLWAVATARGGHIYLRSAEGTLKSVASGKLPGLEVRAQSGYVLAPPSIHPTGAIYQWIAQEGDAPPLVQPHIIDFLRNADGVPIALETVRPRSTRERPGMHDATKEYLSHGHSLPEGQRHEAFRRACNNFRDMGYDRADMERRLVPIAQASGLTDQRELERMMDWAMSKVTPKNGVLARVNLPDPAAFDWHGATARSDRAVFAALVERARLGTHATGTFRGAQRELMAHASISDYHTLRKALKRLEDRRLIVKAGEDAASGATLWRWGEVALQGAANAKTKTDGNHSIGSSKREDSSAVDYGLLTPAEQRVLEPLWMTTTPMKARAIAQASGLEVRQVKHALRTTGILRKTQQVVRVRGGWAAGIPDEIALAALRKRAEDKRAAIRKRGDTDRARDAAKWLTRWRYRHDRENFWEYGR
jgi:hypothetical protein